MTTLHSYSATESSLIMPILLKQLCTLLSLTALLSICSCSSPQYGKAALPSETALIAGNNWLAAIQAEIAKAESLYEKHQNILDDLVSHGYPDDSNDAALFLWSYKSGSEYNSELHMLGELRTQLVQSLFNIWIYTTYATPITSRTLERV